MNAAIYARRSNDQHVAEEVKSEVKAVKKIGAKWAPYRTIASWYLWRLLDTPAPVPRSGG